MTKEKGVLFNDFLAGWLKGIKLAHAPSTYAKYCQLSWKHIIPYFEGKRLRDISNEDLERFRKALREGRIESDGRKRTEGTIRSAIMIINQIMRLAYQQREIPEPVSIPFGIKKRKTIVQVFSSEAQRKLEEHIKKNLNDTTLGIYLCLYTGIRLGELCALKWENVNFQEGYLYIKYTVQRLPLEENAGKRRTTLTLTLPKSSSSMRLVPIPSFLLPVLKTWARKASPEHFILTGSEKLPMEPRTIQYRYKRCLESAGVPYLNFHALRHTFATRCITVGIDPKTLSEILGHSDIKITMDYYFHSSFEFKKNQIERLKAFV